MSYPMSTAFATIIAFSLLVMTAVELPARADSDGGTGANDQLVPGYSEQYAFTAGGKSIGNQSATLTRVENGQQTWSFSINISVPTGSAPIMLEQTGTFVVDTSMRGVSYTTSAVVGGVSQGEKLTFANGNLTNSFDPPIPAIAPTFPVDGHPYLIGNNLITMMSLITRANHANLANGIVLPAFSTNALRPIKLMLKPHPGPGDDGKNYKVYQATLIIPGLPEVNLVFWISNSTGEIVRVVDDTQSLQIVKL